MFLNYLLLIKIYRYTLYVQKLVTAMGFNGFDSTEITDGEGVRGEPLVLPDNF